MNRLAFLLALVAAPLPAAPPPGFDARVEALRRSFGVPGLSIAIVENGRTTLARGYGVKRLGAAGPVDADTIMTIGSTSKAFTAADLAVLVDEGKLGWDDKVVDHMPWFQMYDPWVTREMTVRDLLVHRSGLGLGEGDLLFVPRSSLTRREVAARLRYLEPKTSFRSGYAYDNVLYLVAGQLIEEVSGETWERFTRDHLLRPAGMTHTVDDDAGFLGSPDHAQPHARLNGGLRGVGDQEVLDERARLAANNLPAGGISTSASDMARWLAVQLAHGALPGGGRLFSEAAAAEMWKPATIMPIPPARSDELKPIQPNFSDYALGWDVQDYRGAKIVTHGGAVFGFQSTVVLLPDRNVGFAIMINSEDGAIIRGLTDELLDHYLGLPKGDWPAAWARVVAAQKAKGLAAFRAQAAAPAGTGPSLPLARYAGSYADPWYGPIAIAYRGGALHIDFRQTPHMTATLTHWQYDSFKAVWDDRTIEPAFVTFGLDADGRIERITMKPVSPLADFSYDYADLLFTPTGAGGGPQH